MCVLWKYVFCYCLMNIVWLTGTWCFRYNLPSYLIKNVSERGYHHPTAVQMQAIPVMMHVSASLQNRCIMACYRKYIY